MMTTPTKGDPLNLYELPHYVEARIIERGYSCEVY